MIYDWSWRVVTDNLDIFLQGALVAIGLTLSSVVLGSIMGVIVAFVRRSSNPVISFFGKAYIEIFRAIPLLVLLVWIYYVLPILFEIRLSAFVAAAVSLALHLAAFVAETFRAGIESVPKGQFESGIVLGMTYRQVMRRIIFPQAFRNMIPNLMGLYIMELKNSSLASIIAVNELLHRSNILISNTYRPLEIYSMVAFVYLLIILPLVYISRAVERRLLKTEKPSFSAL